MSPDSSHITSNLFTWMRGRGKNIRHRNIDGVDQTLNQDRIGQDKTESKLSIHVRHGQLGSETMDINAI